MTPSPADPAAWAGLAGLPGLAGLAAHPVFGVAATVPIAAAVISAVVDSGPTDSCGEEPMNA